jgi:hypothetical protein
VAERSGDTAFLSSARQRGPPAPPPPAAEGPRAGMLAPLSSAVERVIDSPSKSAPNLSSLNLHPPIHPSNLPTVNLPTRAPLNREPPLPYPIWGSSSNDLTGHAFAFRDAALRATSMAVIIGGPKGPWGHAETHDRISHEFSLRVRPVRHACNDPGNSLTLEATKCSRRGY